MKIALIPARSGSKRVPNKNIRKLNGIPLLAYSIKTAKDCGLVDRIVVSTDSMAYAAIANSYGAEAIIRPEDISTGNTPDLPVVQHFLEHYPDTEQIVYLRPTTPLREVHRISNAIAEFNRCLMYSTVKPDSLRSIEETSESAYKYFTMKGKFLNGLMACVTDTNLPNHYYPETFKANGYVDILLPETVKEQQDIYGTKIRSYETPPVTEVDTEREFKLLEWEIGNGNVHK